MPALPCDIITAGFPCQDVSYGGKGGSIHHPRTGLWYEAFRRIRDIRPKYAILENVPGLFRRGFSRLLRDLASIGYDAEWHCIPASAIGAPHVRNRIWIVAYPTRIGLEGSRTPRFQEPQLPIRWGTLRRYRAGEGAAQWQDEPKLDRLVDGIPRWVDRVRVLGNSIVPQMAHYLGYCILEIEQ
jgi:DNA (cytosine-5)-methyltransferase 1